GLDFNRAVFVVFLLCVEAGKQISALDHLCEIVEIEEGEYPVGYWLGEHIVSEIKDAFGNKQYKPEDIQELIRKLFNDVKNIHEELAEYINTPSSNRLAFYNYDDDDEDYTIAVTSVLSTQEPVDSLIKEDEHLDTIPTTKSDEVIKSSVEDLVPIPSESEGIPDNISNLFNVNPTPDRVLKSPSPLLIPVEDSDSFFEKFDTSLSYSDNSLPEFETFSDHTKEANSGSTTTHADNSLPNYDSFLFKIKPDQGELTSVFMEDNLREPRVHVPNVLPTHPTLYLDSNFTPFDNSLPNLRFFALILKRRIIEPDLGELTSIVDSGIRENVLFATNVKLSPEDDQSPLFAYVLWIFFLFSQETESEPIIRDIGDEEEEYPFVNKYPCFQEEPIVLVEEESCPVYDTDNEKEESMPVNHTDIEDVVEEEKGFVGKGGFGGEEDNIEDVVVVANDLFPLMIQTILSVDFEEDINTKSHELMSFGKCIIIKVSQSSFTFLICKKYQEWYLKAPPMVDKLGFKTIEVRGRVIIKKGTLMHEIQIWMLQVQGTSEENSRTSLFKWGRMMQIS
nr:hypothetical protein [Tanacetum cinerariifolium]